jgi:hypothetical protein
MEWRNTDGRLETHGGNEYVGTLLAALQRLPRAAFLAREMWSKSAKAGRPGEDKANLVTLVQRMTRLFETRLRVPATKPVWADGLEAYVGDFYDLMELMASHLPALPGTLGDGTPVSRGKAIQRAFDEMVSRARLMSGHEDIIGPRLTITHALREGHNRRRSKG